MAHTTEAEREQSGAVSDRIVNDVVIKVATPNGSGSQSANLILMRAIFSMGVPTSGKNLFPSNIQGLPTWFTIRANEKGWLAQRTATDIGIAMNADSVIEDIEELPSGATLIIRKRLAHFVQRDDLDVFVIPFTDLASQFCDDARMRAKVINVIYVGAVAHLLNITMDTVIDAIAHQFGGKQKAIEINQKAAQAGYDWADQNITKKPLHVIQPSKAAANKILVEGNEASALGLTFGGVQMAAWYPITPSSSVCEYLLKYLDDHRRDPESGRATYAVVQAEDELAAMGMVLGASWAGVRSVTSTSGPGTSLMAEMAGLSYFAEIPSVIINVQRLGPSTGLPTRNSQGDIASCYGLSHGDCNHVLLIPGSVEECYTHSMRALDLAEELQTLIFVMSDLDLGMNKWLSGEFKAPTEPLKRGKVLDAKALDAVEEFARYRDIDGDGIPYRTLPGTPHEKAAYFTRGTGHTDKAGYSEDSEIWQDNMDRLKRKFDTARHMVPKPVIDEEAKSGIGIIAYGSSDLAVQEARHILRDEHNINTDYLRIRALPVNSDVSKYIMRHDKTYLIEQNRDGQMAAILRAEYPALATKIDSILHYNGIPIDALSIVDSVLAKLSANEEVS
jgi:2-oxoglutarate ferredoxin oxidoreductase subunit alpha